MRPPLGGEAACGGEHTVVLTSDGSLYSFGEGSNGQLGGDTKNENYPYLMRDFRQLGRRAELRRGRVAQARLHGLRRVQVVAAHGAAGARSAAAAPEAASL